MMWDWIRKLCSDSFTGIDGKTFDPLKIVGYPSCVLAVLIYFANSLYLSFSKGAFDYVAFGGGFAALMGALLAVGAGVAVKSKTEPS